MAWEAQPRNLPGWDHGLELSAGLAEDTAWKSCGLVGGLGWI